MASERKPPESVQALNWEKIQEEVKPFSVEGAENLLGKLLWQRGVRGFKLDMAGAEDSVLWEALSEAEQESARGLLQEGWLEARHDGGILEAMVRDSSAELVLGWRSEVFLFQRTDRALSGMRVVDPVAGCEDLVLSKEDRDTFSLYGEGDLNRRGGIVVFVGSTGSGKTARAEALAAQCGCRILLPSSSSIVDPKRSFLRNIEILSSMAQAMNAVLLFEHAEHFFPRSFPLPLHCETWAGVLEIPGIFSVLTTAYPDRLDPLVAERAEWVCVLSNPRTAGRRELWAKMLGKHPVDGDLDLDRLSRRFELNPGGIGRAIKLGFQSARQRASGKKALLKQEDLEKGSELQVRHGLDTLARRVHSNLSIDDLIVADGVREQVESILDAARVRETVFDDWGFAAKQQRGRGLSMLFDGEPGTGKTLCAEILSAELASPLYRVSMADVLSKWVGETEKNLQRIFQEARGSRSILLFDEADALFSKRVEVQHANDRFANLEINALLQLMESHDGISILTTNLKSGIDKAFERRLSFRVHFPFPDEDLRSELWRHHLPAQAPVGAGVDIDILASAYELSGGSIRNAVVRAAYRAAAREDAILQHDLMEGAKSECVASGKLYRVLQDED